MHYDEFSTFCSVEEMQNISIDSERFSEGELRKPLFKAAKYVIIDYFSSFCNVTNQLGHVCLSSEVQG